MMAEPRRLMELRFRSADSAARAWLALAGRRYRCRFLHDLIQVVAPEDVVLELDADLIGVDTDVSAEILERVW